MVDEELLVLTNPLDDINVFCSGFSSKKGPWVEFNLNTTSGCVSVLIYCFIYCSKSWL